MVRTVDSIWGVTADGFPLDAEEPETVETATFALGCFWGAEAIFGVQEGVIRTRACYAGGSKDDPTYHDLGNHTETIQVDYDPKDISYRQLLELFWSNHNPTRQQKTQYMSIIFYHNDRQQELAERTKEYEEDDRGKLYTEIRPVGTVYLAEDYHQKYHLRQHDILLEELKSVYSDDQLINSTVAARMNGYIFGERGVEALDTEIAQFGLSDEAREELRGIVARRTRRL